MALPPPRPPPDPAESGGPPGRSEGTGDTPPARRESTASREDEDGASAAWRGWAAWGSLGMEFAAGIVVFFLLGSWADDRWGTDPWLRVAGAFIGIVLGTYLLIKKALAANFTDRRDANDRRG